MKEYNEEGLMKQQKAAGDRRWSLERPTAVTSRAEVLPLLAWHTHQHEAVIVLKHLGEGDKEGAIWWIIDEEKVDGILFGVYKNTAATRIWIPPSKHSCLAHVLEVNA
jgi:hypothetical protein